MEIKLNQIIILTYLILSAFSIGCKEKNSPIEPTIMNIPDTTSHEFIWQKDELGDGEASILRDVSVISENDVWAVGEIYLKDSTGQFVYPPFGVAHWNGFNWELKKLPVKALDYTSFLTPTGIYAFSSDDIWFCSGGIHHYNGKEIRSFWVNRFPGNKYAILDSGQSVEKVWGTSDTNIWAVGRHGSIVHYDGTSWQKLESGTIQDLQDIWGAKNSITEEYEILAIAGNIYESYDKEILKINSNNVEEISTEGINWALDAVWFDPGRVYYAVGAGIYSKKTMDKKEIWTGPGLGVTRYSSHAVRGNHAHDVFVAGAFGDVLHYNGINWYSYHSSTALSQGSYYSIAVYKDWVFAVGHNYDKAVILRGKRRISR